MYNIHMIVYSGYQHFFLSCTTAWWTNIFYYTWTPWMKSFMKGSNHLPVLFVVQHFLKKGIWRNMLKMFICLFHLFFSIFYKTISQDTHSNASWREETICLFCLFFSIFSKRGSEDTHSKCSWRVIHNDSIFGSKWQIMDTIILTYVSGTNQVYGIVS